MEQVSKVWEIERDRFGVMFSGPLEVGECRRVAPYERVSALEEALEAAIGQFEADCPELAAEIRRSADA
jgi:hypothetical protein